MRRQSRGEREGGGVRGNRGFLGGWCIVILFRVKQEGGGRVLARIEWLDTWNGTDS